ncbi:MAG: C10 family peptidase [Bacteroidaceae bacterium]|nr:C10 family peptidase [Bacteroidaceae bacterium]
MHLLNRTYRQRIIIRTQIALSFIIALSFWTSIVSAQSLQIERASVFAPEKAELVYLAGKADAPDFCVFNDIDKNGFVIVAPDEIFGNGLVLAYSDEGEFDYNQLPDNAKWLLSQYQEQIEYIRKNHIETAARTSGRADSVVIAPLLASVKWDQTYPFNILCPNDGKGTSLTGCAATAMAQVMWYYRWPLSGTGYHSYRWEYGSKYRTLSVDFSKSEYDWSLMPGKYPDGQYSNAQADAVSKLMYDCGVSVNMEYSSYGSSAYAEDMCPAMSKYFKYKQAAYKYYHESSSEYEQLLKKELNSRRPVLIGGQNDRNEGHAFVCDGYDSNNYFHYNFGWSGVGDGYYLASVAGGFSIDIELIYKISPNRKKPAADGIFYNQLCRDKMEVTYSDETGSTYSGRITVPSKVTFDTLTYDVTSIGPYAFALSDVTVLDIPDCVNTIVANAMFGCRHLDTIFVHWDKPLDCETSTFDNTVYSKAVLVVPEGKAEAYSEHRTWSLFSTIITADNISDSQKWTEWELVTDSDSRYSYALPTLKYGQSDRVTVYSRHDVQSATKAQYKIDNWLLSSLVIDVDLKTGMCKVPKQSTGIIYSDWGEMMVSDIPTFNRMYNYKEYPCQFDTINGTFSLNLIYHGNMPYSNVVDSVYLYGYPKYGISLTDMTLGAQGDISCKVSYEKDVAQYGYALLHGRLSGQQIKSAIADFMSGTKELEFPTGNTLTAQLDESDAYTLIVAAVDKYGTIRNYAANYLSFIANKPEWVEEYEGRYLYQTWKKVTQNDVVLFHDKNNPRYWKLSRMYNGSEFVFRWYDDGTLEFDEQPSGFKNGSSIVNVSDNKYSDKPKKGSYYDSSKGVLYFDTYYVSSTHKYGWEAFVIETKTSVTGPVTETPQRTIYNISGQKLDHTEKGLNIINGRKVFLEIPEF